MQAYLTFAEYSKSDLPAMNRLPLDGPGSVVPGSPLDPPLYTQRGHFTHLLNLSFGMADPAIPAGRLVPGIMTFEN